MAPLTFRNEDEEAQYCLSTLRDGTREEKIVARGRLAAIFARRGLHEEAAELYELNIRAGVRSPDVFERLSETYRHLGDVESAEAALAEARRLRSIARPRPAPVPPPPPASADGRVIPLTGASAPSQPERQHPVTGSGSDFGIPSPTGGRASAAPARSPQEASGVAPDVPEDAPALTPSPESEADGHPRRAGRAVPGPLLVVGVVLFMIVLPVILLALFVINPLGLYLEGRPAGPVVDATSGEPPRLKVAPGTTATWYLQTGRSVSGLWATPGLDLTLAQPVEGAGSTFGVTAPRPQTWGETITIVERRGQGRANQETIVPATFEAPRALPPAGTVLDGRIAGRVTAPRLTESGQFNTSTQSVDLPVQLVVVSGLDLWLDRFGNALRMFFDEDRWLLVTIGAILTWCVLAGAAAILYRARRT
jgi:hypothetical protein